MRRGSRAVEVAGCARRGLAGLVSAVVAPLVLAPVVMMLVGLGCGTDEVSFSANSSSGTTASASSSGAGGGGGGSTGSGGAGMGGQGGQPVQNNGFPEAWINGTDCGSEPDYQVWAYASDTFILRQSLCSHFEGPFIYVLLGDEAVFVQDTGTGNVNLYSPIATIVSDWVNQRGLGPLPVYVTHSHGHGDHVGGDNQFSGQPDVTVVGPSSAAVQAFFGFRNWPDDIVTLDLGGRLVDVLAIPGHQSAHVAVYDAKHQLLLTGDTLYPGRLYINNWQQYRASVQRMVDFVESNNPVDWVLGTHIEMRNSSTDFPMGASSHPDEHPLQLGYDVLLELNAAAQAMGNNPAYQEHADFIIYP